MKTRESAPGDPAPAGSVFVVDDNVTLGELAVAVLESAGYEVRRFCDPKAVLEALEKANPKPSVLVTDYEMGEMNGLELIESSHKLHPSLKTVLLSGTVDGSVLLRGSTEVNRFLGKPYEPAQLKRVVADLLGA